MTYGRTSVVLSLLVLLSMTSCGVPTEAIDGPVAPPITGSPSEAVTSPSATEVAALADGSLQPGRYRFVVSVDCEGVTDDPIACPEGVVDPRRSHWRSPCRTGGSTCQGSPSSGPWRADRRRWRTGSGMDQQHGRREVRPVLVAVSRTSRRQSRARRRRLRGRGRLPAVAPWQGAGGHEAGRRLRALLHSHGSG